MKLGLIGFPLSHSFSKRYFREKFLREKLAHCSYENFPLENIAELPLLLEQTPLIQGLNVTIPHKQNVIQFMDSLDDEAAAIHAVNTIVISSDGLLSGYNSDIYGFQTTLTQFIPSNFSSKALVLGTGGASKAVCYVLKKLGITYRQVSRSKSQHNLVYDDINKDLLQSHHLMINTTPLGMHPNIDDCPNIPYSGLSNEHFLYDLIYNPSETKFLSLGKARGAKIMNGMEMLVQQAEKSWEIWNGTH